jgi:amino acid transporter
MSELAAAMPDEGGYVTWTRRAFGPFWSFQVGWWSWIDSFIDVAVYPALAVEYARYWWPGMTPLTRGALVLGFVLVLTALNVVGVRPVGRAALVLAAVALAPVLLLVVVGLTTLATVPWRPFVATGESAGAGVALGLAVVMWNYSGWDTPSTTLGETRTPERTFRRALFVALPIITAAYVLPVAVILASGTTTWTTWGTAGFPVLAHALGGPWLGHAVAAGAVVAAAGQFVSQLLTNSRLPFVLARDGQMPAALARVHPHFQTPWLAVLVSAAVYTALAGFAFRELVVLNVWLYSLSLIVELAAFVALRRREPGMSRPWRVPGGAVGAWIAAGVPAALSALAMATAGWSNTIAGVSAAATGPLAYALFARRPR